MSTSLTPTQVGGLLAVTLLLSVGQILFKSAAQYIDLNHGVVALARSFLTWQLLLALIIYGIGTLLWILVLVNVPLSRAYPFVAIGFAITPLIASFVFSEPLTPAYWAGVALLLCGLYVITRAAG
jgi:multidrug transporter EmrE-like cation transporter